MHDEGDLGDEGFWSTAAMLADPTGIEGGATGDAPSNVAWDTPTVAQQATAPTTSIAEVRLG